MTDKIFHHLAFIGFGEVGGIFAQDTQMAGRDVVVYDPLLLDQTKGQKMAEKAAAAKVRTAYSLGEALSGAELIFSATTASSALEIALHAAAYLRPGQIYVDLNSVSPETKRRIDAAIVKSGADFVEAAVMAAVKSTRLKTPILLGGVRAAELAANLQMMGMNISAASTQIGTASAIKMCRSVVMKGMAALVIESLFAARRYGAEEPVLASFDATYPSMGWKAKLPDLLVMRSVEHSRRRAAELREVAETLQDAGMVPRMALAAAELQDWLTAEMEAGHYIFQANEPFSWMIVADAIAHPPEE